MDALYEKARREKVKELRKIMQELMATSGDDELDGDGLEEALAEAGEAATEETEASAEGVEEVAVEEEEEEESELERMKREYFKPKAPERRPGTATFMASESKMQAPAKRPVGRPKKYGV